MRKISLNTFWNNVRLHDDVEKVAKIFAAFNQENMQFSSVIEAHVHAVEKMIPANQANAEINGCHNPSVRSYYLRVLDFMDETVGDKVEWLDKGVAPMEMRKYHAVRLANLSRSYAYQKKCHPTKKNFICYCQP